ncbi:uncharacterized protein [Linepithema humile]|uniref:uncharacterized protein n=1 Tax=Linepithema humile TaxID=83485 RepID=UPI00062354DF|nr:PREDICTED: uncharacterized protein LOC105668204 [Linepithema humile]
MKKPIATVRTPFQNLKFLIILNKLLGLLSCKLVNGRFKESSVWGRGYCALWLLFHCAYSSYFYYTMYMATPAEKAEKLFALGIVRFSAFFISLLPYNYLGVFRSQDFIMFSEKLEAYDDKATALGHQRKDKHIFTWLYFAYTFSTIFIKTYNILNSSIPEGREMIVTQTFETVIPTICGTYCVFISAIFLDLIRQRFRHLNEVIVPYVSELPVTGLKGEITVYDVRYLHGVLIDSAGLINRMYGIGTLLTFGSILLEFISVIYLFITDVQDNATVILLDLLFQTIYLFAMYHCATYEANRVEERVLKYGLSFKNSKCRMDKIEMMLYFYHNRFTFTAAEFFIIDLTILLPIASTVSTYLTLIIN